MMTALREGEVRLGGSMWRLGAVSDDGGMVMVRAWKAGKESRKRRLQMGRECGYGCGHGYV